MNREVQQLHLESFVSQVLQPAHERWAATSERGELDCWARWALGEVRESMDLLRIGQALSLFPPDSLELVSRWVRVDYGDSRFTENYAAMAVDRRLRELLQASPESMSVAVKSSGAAQKAMARSFGLFRGACLIASSMGHGVASEALAQLSQGSSAACLESIRRQAVRERFDRLTAARAINALADPENAVSNRARTDGIVLSASVFHGLEFMYSVAYAQQDLDGSLSEEDRGNDILRARTGVGTSDMLHRVLYWRIPANNDRFREDFLEAVRRAAVVLFRLGALEHKDVEDNTAYQYAGRLAERVSKALNLWSVNLRVDEEAGADGSAGSEGQTDGRLQGGMRSTDGEEASG